MFKKLQKLLCISYDITRHYHDKKFIPKERKEGNEGDGEGNDTVHCIVPCSPINTHNNQQQQKIT